MNKYPSTVKILVVDDEPEVVEQLCEYLENQGYACTPAHSAIQGIERYQADEQIGLVLCDLHLPQIDGIEMVHALKKLTGRQRVFEAIMLTGQAEKQRSRTSSAPCVKALPITTKSPSTCRSCSTACDARRRRCWSAGATSMNSGT